MMLHTRKVMSLFSSWPNDCRSVRKKAMADMVMVVPEEVYLREVVVVVAVVVAKNKKSKIPDD